MLWRVLETWQGGKETTDDRSCRKKLSRARDGQDGRAGKDDGGGDDATAAVDGSTGGGNMGGYGC
eukprot:m.249206 g.249206  ORF g.249206 m.249206 type:complete len:65 (+) comp16006_c0_seq1:158-352(+)